MVHLVSSAMLCASEDLDIAIFTSEPSLTDEIVSLPTELERIPCYIRGTRRHVRAFLSLPC